MSQFNRAHLLTELRKGPLESRYWRSVATTQKALHVRIHQLREKGYQIEAETREGTWGQVVYHLRGEPCCKHCGR